MIDFNEVYDLIAPSKANLIEIAKAVRTDFEGVLGYYQVFEKMPIEQALMRISKYIVEAYKDKEDLWNEVKQRLN
ncbi:hypothetical protein [Clostridium botulinum]|uniref:hypothetical protein n=1 Tax=Clostridium botulinum TaxID=1491 RepID=UPI0019672463|nr:hypothetical protein [Clostridium botulinum]MBN1077728.1 hypothetical protein [Clostridium botulinum]